MAVDLESGSKDGHLDRLSSKPNQKTSDQATKNNVVDWDGPEDPQNPLNWPAWKRMTQVVLASAFLLTA
jgi:hypothetical protein